MGKARILTASAGAGKTYQLAYKYVSDVIERPYFYRNILAVTFTNKATEEMKSRILREINKLAKGERTPYLNDLLRDFPQFDARDIQRRALESRTMILHDYSRFTVLTIDKFFQRIIRAFLKELNLDLNYNIEIETESVLDRSIDSLIESISSDEQLKRWLIEFARERIDENARWDVRDSIRRLGAEIFKEAGEDIGAETNKEDLNRRMKKAAERNRKIEEQMKSTARQALAVMDEYGLVPSDFRGGSRSFTGYFAAASEGFAAPTAAARKMLDEEAEWAAAKSPVRAQIEAAKSRLQPLLAELCSIYDRNIRRYNATRLFRETFRSYALLADLYDKVAADCESEGTVLLSQTKNILSEFIDRNDTPFIYEKVGNRYEHFMIDEFQDTSLKEWRNFLPLLRNALAQSERTPVLIVGDVKQSIYRWRGGDWQILGRRVAEELGVENVEERMLVENRRSLSLIVRFNNALIGRIVERDGEVLASLLDEAHTGGALGVGEAAELKALLPTAYRGHSQRPCSGGRNEGYVSITRYGLDGDSRIPPVIECIERILGAGFRPSDIMILTRNKEDGKRIATMLLDYTGSAEARYRFDVITQDALSVSYDPVSGFIIACLRLAVDPLDDLSRVEINRYLDDNAGARPLDATLSADEEEFFRRLRSLSPEDAFEQITMHYKLDSKPSATAYVQALHELIVNFCITRVADIPLFLRWWDEKGYKTSLSAQENNEAVEISTIHRSKGLERKVVILPYCNWKMEPITGSDGTLIWADSSGSEFDGLGRIPLRYKSAMAQSDFSADYYRERVGSHIDSINLLYVALTRAKEQLHIMYPDSPASSSVAALLDSAIRIDGDRALLDARQEESDSPIEGRVSETGNCRRIEFGRFDAPEPQPARSNSDEKTPARLILTEYPTRDTMSQLKLRLPMERYFDDGDVHLSPRNMGIEMHKAFENAENVESIFEAIETMRRNAQLSAAEAETLRRMIERAMENPVVAEWFGDGWDSVRTEHNIICPDGNEYRPDRVMISGDRVVVMDYKFGMKCKPDHVSQISAYCSLFAQMGYRRIEGWLWYVALNEIKRVEV